MEEDAPKSAYELAMERLRRRDAESGASEVALTDAQKAAIAEARQVHAARKAQVEIMHRAALAATFEPEVRARVEEEYRRDLGRLESERDQKIDAARRKA